MKKHLPTLVLSFILCHISFVCNAQWTLVGLQGRNTTSLMFTDNMIFAGTDVSGVFYSPDNGLSWQSRSNGIKDTAIWGSSNFQIAGFAVTDSLIFTATLDTIYSSADYGATWQAVPNTGMTVVNTVYYHLTQNQGAVFAMTNDYNGIRNVKRTIDNGTNWTGIGQYNAFAFNSGYAYFATHNRFYLSPNNGTNCTLQPGTGLPVLNGWLDAMTATDTAIEYLAWVGQYSAIYRTTNNGQTWDSIYKEQEVNTMLANGPNVYIGLYSFGVRFSSDTGNTWSALNTGLSSTAINDLKINNGFLYAATGSGVYKIDLTQITGISPINIQVSTFSIFPNPANESVTIQVNEKLVGSIVTVTAITGRTIFKSEIANPKSEIACSNWSSGVYFVNVCNATRKLIITK